MIRIVTIKAIIHDWDDTITNSFQSYSKFYLDFSQYHELENTNLETLKKFWGATIPEIVTGLWPQLSPTDAEEKTKAFIATLNDANQTYPVKVFPKVKETIIKLNAEGIKLGVISSGRRPQIEAVYKEQIDPIKMFHEFIFDHDDLGYKKPDLRVFDEPLKRLAIQNVQAEETIYVGDSLQDYNSAKNRGLVFFAVTTGVKTKQDFVEAGLRETYILEEFCELTKLI